MPETITVEKLVYGGHGLARLEGHEVMFIEGALPTESVSVKNIERKKKLQFAQVDEVLSASEYRVTPECPNAGVCGGCDWQHLSVEQQRYWKQEIVKETVVRQAKVSPDIVAPIIAASPSGYRNTVVWHVGADGTQPQLAYHQRGTNYPFVFDACLVLSPLLTNLAEHLNNNAQCLYGIETIKARGSSTGQILIGVTVNETGGHDDVERFSQWAMQLPAVRGVFLLEDETPELIAGNETIQTEMNELKINQSIAHFMQVNPQVSTLLLNQLNSLLTPFLKQLPPAPKVLDLYCGVGVLGLSVLQFLLAQQFKPSLLGVELDETAIALAQKNANINQLGGYVEFKAMSTSLWQPVQHEISVEMVDVAIVDPPRNGLTAAVIEQLCSAVARAIIYVSCNPTTLARDLKLFEASGFKPQSITPLDMFPHTYHVETITVLLPAVADIEK